MDPRCPELKSLPRDTFIEGDRAIHLLNPPVLAAEGKGEAWFFGKWLPGARRYRSFREPMRTESEPLLRMKDL